MEECEDFRYIDASVSTGSLASSEKSLLSSSSIHEKHELKLRSVAESLVKKSVDFAERHQVFQPPQLLSITSSKASTPTGGFINYQVQASIGAINEDDDFYKQRAQRNLRGRKQLFLPQVPEPRLRQRHQLGGYWWHCHQRSGLSRQQLAIAKEWGQERLHKWR